MGQSCVLFVDIVIVLLIRLYLPMVKSLTLMKVSYSSLLMVNCLALHLGLQMESHSGLMKELSWVLQMAPLMVLMKSNLRVPCLDIDLEKKLVLHLLLLMVLMKELSWVLQMAPLMVLMKGLCSVLLMVL